MRVLASAFAIWFVALTGSAFAQGDESKYFVTASIGEAYGFPESGWVPVIQEEDTEGSLTFGVKLTENWTVSASHIVTDDEEGFAVGVQYRRGSCFGPIGCSVAVNWRDVGDDSAVYSAGVFADIPLGLDWVEAKFDLSGTARAGDNSEGSATGAFQFTFPLGGRFEASASAGASYGFETDETEPTWGAGLSYTHEIDRRRNIEFGVSYETVQTLDEFNELKFDRVATAEITFNF